MKTHAANEKLQSIISLVEKKGISADSLIEDLKALREMAQNLRLAKYPHAFLR